jgi:biopolymer transport protein ExbB
MNTAVVDISPWQLIVMGGPVMVPIFICSVFALTIVIQKFSYFRSLDTDALSLKDLVLNEVRQNNIKEAVLACDASGSWAAPILKAGLIKFGGSRQEITDAMDEAARFEVPRIERGMTVLSTIASVTPLLGLLGTVLGLCGAFHIIQMRAAAMNPVTPGDIAGGIWQALITTVFGLVVAIPAFIIYNYFVDRVHGIVRDMERTASRLADLMTRVSDLDISEKE